MKKSFFGLVLCLIIVAAVFFLVLPSEIERQLNAVLSTPPYLASPRARTVHAKLAIVDLHADSLLWGRDLLSRSHRGHVDVPRLIEGNVALQAFSLPTKTPRGLNYERNDDSSDNIFWLALSQRWPRPTWTSLTERALYQAHRLHQMAARSRGKFVLILSAQDLNSYVEHRPSERGITAGLLSIEGAHALDGDLENLDILYNAGYRMMSPSHFFDNDLGGSSAGVQKIGLTEKGKELVRRMEVRHMIIDLAHASSATIDDVLAVATRPVVVSHTGVKATCNNNRNLSDAQIIGVAKTGGVIGIGYWETATCGKDARATVGAMRHVADLVGVEHVALGSDFDGAVIEPFDTTGLVEITDALLADGFTEDQVGMIMGRNALKLLKENLSWSPSPSALNARPNAER